MGNEKPEKKPKALENDENGANETQKKPKPVSEQELKDQRQKNKERQEDRENREKQDTEAEVEELRDMAEKLVSGQEIVKEAESRLSSDPDAKVLCKHATSNMGSGERESLGKDFYDWSKYTSPIIEQFRKDIDSKTDTKDENADAETGEQEVETEATTKTVQESSQDIKDKIEEEVEKNKQSAIRSMSGTVKRFLNDLNGIPPAKTENGKVWEEIRQKAQNEFEKNNTEEGQAAFVKWGSLMGQKFMVHASEGRHMQATPFEDEDGTFSEEEIQKKLDEKGVDLSDWLRELQANNLMEDTQNLTKSKSSDLTVDLLDEKGEKISDVESLIKADKEESLEVVINPRNNLTPQMVIGIIEATPFLPKASINADGKVTFEGPLSLSQARRFFQVLSREDIEEGGDKQESEDV